ncbi:FUSC family protein [Rhodococcus sp. NPDC058521]|uniref:FUSC family protein n=1 Tax=Rhodococcus sp. NPDC058521 TaxID=3346536 RepID=UPI003665E299
MRVRPADATVGPALRVGSGVAIALVVGGLLGHPMLGAIAGLGAITAAFCRHQPMPLLAPRLMIYGAISVAFVFLGSFMSAANVPTAIQLLTFSVGAGVAAHLFTAFEITGPGPVVVLLSGSAAAGPSNTLADVPVVTAAAVAGAALGLVAALAPRILHPMGAARLAVARALAAVARLEQFEESRDVAARKEAVVGARGALAHAHSTIDLSHPTSQHGRALSAVLAEADAAVDEWIEAGASHRISSVTRHERELRKIRRTCDIPDYDPSDTVRIRHVESPVSLWTTAHERLISSTSIASAIRTAVAAAISSYAAVGLHLAHPMWAMFGAVAALQGLSFAHTVERGIQRAIGNLVGALLAIAFLAAGPLYWHLVIGIVVLLILAELWAPRQYAVTSMVLGAGTVLFVALGADITSDVAFDRAADTLVGVVVGIVIAALTLSPTDPIRAEGA